MRLPPALPLLLVVIASGCAGSGESQVEERAPAELVFIDSDLFDKALSRAMWGKSDFIVVEMAAPVPLNDIPERFDRWIYLIGESYGNKVELVPDPALPQEKSAEALGIALAIQAYSYAKESLLYAPCRRYDATLFVDPGAGVITRALFERRQQAAEEE